MDDELIRIQEQIIALKKKEQELKDKKRPILIEQMRRDIDAYGITALDLGFSNSMSSSLSSELKSSNLEGMQKKKVKPKYISEDGQTWSGRGIKPKWLKTAEANGKTKDDFLI